MLVLHQPLHRQRRLWRKCGLLGRLQMEFFVTNIHPVQSSRRATYATISQRPFAHIARITLLFIYDVLIYFFICSSFNSVVGNSGQVTQYGMVG